MELVGAVALVTGASRGVGRAIALALADADVACAARATDDQPLKLPGTIDATVREIEARGRRGLAVPADLSKPEEVEAMVARTIDAFGRG
jgi:NAD(P)-dependent dehydrogenase (short-subunit alcohol dehydrogenase family)